MKDLPNIEDLIGIGHTKLGFFKEVQEKISQLRASNLALNRERQQVQAILDGIGDVIALVSLDFTVRAVNHSYHGIFPHSHPADKTCYQIFRNGSSPCKECPLVLARQENRIIRQTAIIRVGEQNRQFEITASPLRDANQIPTDIIIVKRDVTLEKAFQAKFYHAEKMATIGLLAAGVAHEINNPLAAISGFAEGLKRRIAKLEFCTAQGKDIREDFQENINVILTECNRCRDIVQGLLTFSPRKNTEFSPVDINDLVKVVLRLLNRQLKKFSRDYVVLALNEALPEVKGVAAELEQVILNLMLNAMDATREKGQILIRSGFDKENRVFLSLEDTGCGISDEDKPKLFEPFFTTKPVGKGIGIGLSTCYNIIQQHGGEIRVKSKLGKGAVFTVRLPIPQGAP
ncbi:MAG: ATP-binding protein [Desulfobacterales bacterium]|jgi:signal transduction histidine kinase|nr:ATP-binding protein [Desulfobacterales bacterium]